LTKPAPEVDTDLAEILDAWPALAEPIKSAILTLARTAAAGGRKG
jgi:hypothetical protein